MRDKAASDTTPLLGAGPFHLHTLADDILHGGVTARIFITTHFTKPFILIAPSLCNCFWSRSPQTLDVPPRACPQHGSESTSYPPGTCAALGSSPFHVRLLFLRAFRAPLEMDHFSKFHNWSAESLLLRLLQTDTSRCSPQHAGRAQSKLGAIIE